MRFTETAESDVRSLRRQLEQDRAQRDQTTTLLSAAREKLSILEDDAANTSIASLVLQDEVAQWKLETSGRVDSLVSTCLREVFEDDYRFETLWVSRRGKVEAEFRIYKEEGKPEVTLIGGVGDVIAFALRVISWAMSVPRTRPILILDEPFRFVSESFQSLDRVRDLVVKVCSEFGIQVLMVTHESTLQDVGTVYLVRGGEVEEQ